MRSLSVPVHHVLLAALLVVGSCASVQAQEKKRKTQVVLYREHLAAQFDTVNCVKNVLKLNPLLFFRGEIPLYYERALTPNLSVELGLGITTRNYMGYSLSGDDVDAYSAGEDIIIRPSYHLGVRYYTTDDIEPQGIYLQLEFAHLEYTKDITEKSPTGEFTDMKLRDERIFNDLRLLFGYQVLAASSNWMMDFYTGFGLRDRSMQLVNEELDLTNDTYTYTVDIVDDQVLAFFLGFKVGLGF